MPLGNKCLNCHPPGLPRFMLLIFVRLLILFHIHHQHFHIESIFTNALTIHLQLKFSTLPP